MNESKISMKKEKQVKRKFLLLYILDKIAKGHTPYEIYKTLGWTRQRLNYYLKRLKNEGFIELKYRSNIAFYELSPKGKNFYIRYVSLLTGSIRLHNIIFSYPILKLGKLEYQKTWKANGVTFFYLKWNSNIALKWSYKNMHVMISSLFGNDAFKLLDEAKNLANSVIKELKENHGFEFGEGKIIRKPHMAIISEHANHIAKLLSEKLGVQVSSENGIIDESFGFSEYEITGENEDEIVKLTEASINFPKRLLKIENDLEDLKKDFIPAIKELTQQIKLHLEVMKEMKETLREIREALRGLKK